jgi:hypothetical protein
MPREEENREDLLREATALTQRAELQIDDFPDTIVVGFRNTGAASFFFGQQIVYHFNPAAELRRAFIDGHLYKADRGRLARLTRTRTADAVNLMRHDLTPAETSGLLTTARSRLSKLQSALDTDRFSLLGEVPPDANIIQRVRNWLANLPQQIPIAVSPHASG